MCKRTRRERMRKQKPKPKKTPKKKKNENVKKLTCCQRFRRRVRIWACRRLKRCLKRIIFGYTDPQLEDFEIAGYNLGSVRDKFKYKNSKVSIKENKEIIIEKKSTVLTIDRKNVSNKFLKSYPFKDIIVDEIETYSLSKSIRQKLQKYLGVKYSQQNLNTSEKEISKSYQLNHKNYSNKDFIKNMDTLKKRFSLTLSKEAILKNMFDDCKNKKYSFTGVIDKSKYNKSKFDLNDFEKKDLDKIISHYKAQKKSKVNFLDKKFSIGELDFVNKIDPDGLKKKFSLTNSRQILLTDMIEDLKNKKFELSAVPENSKVDIKKNNKENLNKILDYYKSSKDKKRFSFIKQSRFKQIISDLRAKLNSL